MKSVGEVMAIGRTFQQAFAKAMRSRELDVARRPRRLDDEALLERAGAPGADRYDVLLEAFAPRRRRSSELHARTAIDPWFLRELRELALDPSGAVRRRAHATRRSTPARPSSRPRRRTTTRAGSAGAAPRRGRAAATAPSVVILGSGPNRIGQGIEFDYCCVHAAMTVRESGRDAVMVNCNPETVSTDYDTSDRLYFEPLTLEDVLGDRARSSSPRA